jgi:hypothetical protein
MTRCKFHTKLYNEILRNTTAATTHTVCNILVKQDLNVFLQMKSGGMLRSACLSSRPDRPQQEPRPWSPRKKKIYKITSSQP